MDAETAKQYDEVINRIRDATLENGELIRKQTELFQVALHFNKDTFGSIERKINEFADLANNPWSGSVGGGGIGSES